MPSKPKQPCRFPGCTEVTTDKSGYCAAHKKKVAKSFEMKRETATQRGYTYRWHKARIAFLHTHPLCEECLRQGITNPATVVDHIEPHKGDPNRMWDIDNWQSLCTTCHNKKTASEGAFGRT